VGLGGVGGSEIRKESDLGGKVKQKSRKRGKHQLFKFKKQTIKGGQRGIWKLRGKLWNAGWTVKLGKLQRGLSKEIQGLLKNPKAQGIGLEGW